LRNIEKKERFRVELKLEIGLNPNPYITP
jgi:hypothetical protein